ncbi:hypothetical protein LWI29_023021 [Acer saccharum]|uniref:TFIIB-type domain-containing protein n=1 Tax=Acer saccharum TaxID=4024 RepID=A0AA39SC14_ACESA|nr:hypothetical protein LWI29_023021 [Acer saccharum]
MADLFCRDCNRQAEVVFDHSTGDTICSECGLVLESHSVDETSEWRTFANESADKDPARVGGSYNPLLTHGGLTTIISGGSGELMSGSVGKWQSRSSNPDKHLIQAFSAISAMSDRVLICNGISNFDCKDRANEIYKKVEDQKPLRGRNQEAIVAACLYIACRQENKPRTVKEFCSVVNGTTKKEIGRAKELIVKHLEAEMGQSVEMGTIHASDYLRRFCSNLGMSNQAVKAAQEAVQKSEELDIRLTHAPAVADISVVTRVAEGTIKNSYKDLHPHLSHIIPDWFANEEDIKSLRI